MSCCLALLCVCLLGLDADDTDPLSLELPNDVLRVLLHLLGRRNLVWVQHIQDVVHAHTPLGETLHAHQYHWGVNWVSDHLSMLHCCEHNRHVLRNLWGGGRVDGWWGGCTEGGKMGSVVDG